MAKLEETPNAGRAEAAYFVRFSLSQRIEHAAIMVSFSLLVLTGLTQKFYEASWAQWVILHLGGIEATRLIHRIFSIVFVLGGAYHAINAIYSLRVKKARLFMFLTLKDFRDAVIMLRYCLGVSQEHPQYDRYNFRQKFEYWGIVFGGVIMIATGAVLFFPTIFTRILPGEVVPAAKVAHSNEALLAFLVVVVWHLYGTHLNPANFPMDSSIFTGRIPGEKMIKEHPLEYTHLTSKEEKEGETKP